MNQIEQKTIDLPASTSDPAEVDVLVADRIFAYVDAAFYFTFARNQTEANTRIVNDLTRVKVGGAGALELPVGGKNLKFYVRAAGSAVTDGFSYTLGTN